MNLEAVALLAAIAVFGEGDQSLAAANRIEGLVLESFSSEPWFDDVSLALAQYAPGSGPQYFGATELLFELNRAAEAIRSRLDLPKAVELLEQKELPHGFAYPPLFLKVVELGLVDFSAWKMLSGDEMRSLGKALARRYRKAGYLPFASRVDNDDVACWVPPNSNEVVIVHDFASKGWERNETLPSFEAWLRMAVDDLIDYET